MDKKPMPSLTLRRSSASSAEVMKKKTVSANGAEEAAVDAVVPVADDVAGAEAQVVRAAVVDEREVAADDLSGRCNFTKTTSRLSAKRNMIIVSPKKFLNV